MAKNIRTEKNKRTDVLYYRMLVVLAALIAVIFCITGMTRTANAKNEFTLTVAPIISIVFACLSVAALAFFIVRRVKKTDETYKILSGGFLTALMLWLTAIFALYSRISERKLIVFIVVTAALYFIYYLYSKEFFVFSLVSALGAALFAAMNSASRTEHIVLAVLTVLLAAVSTVLVLVGQKKAVKIGKFTLFDKKFKTYPFCISSGIMIAGTILGFFMSAGTFYTLVVLFVYYLIFTVISTIKMM